ncbi:hypothetical protein R3P38DRAFT_2589951 [Favolaschia claudopus]|uniref:Alpha-type protein kinase domain-containing protein n=1 Tax=Favolaschia claudopus TaxID=2862362 RepID=A0AAV9Z1I9_9AGAR
MTIWCQGCGQGFKYLEPSRTICFKCEKLDKCNGNETEVAPVEKMKQCRDCGLVIRHLTTSSCKQCEARESDTKPTKPAQGKENISGKSANLQQSHSVISLDSDDGDNVEELNATEMAELKLKLAQNKKASSSLRLRTPGKVKEETPGAGRTLAFLKMRETARKRKDSSKGAQILFKINLFLQKPTGQKLGTCVPPQSRGFPLDDTMEHVFYAVVATFQEPKGRWEREKALRGKSADVYFTFANGTDIPSEYTSDCTYFKKSAITNFTAEMAMYVPYELTLDISESDDDNDEFEEVLANKKRRKSRSKSATKARPGKKLRIKKEDISDYDFPSRIKAEPTELKVGPSGSVKPVTAKFRLNSAVTFRKEYLSNTLDRPQISELYHGVRDIVPKSTPSLGIHFQLSCGNDHYLARRLEDEQFRFNVALELDAARAELLRGQQLRDLLQILIEEHGMLNSSLAECSTPELFIATILDNETVLGHLVCQPIPAIPFSKVVQPELDLLNAISHFSLTQNKGSMLFAKFKVASSEGATSIFAPVTHSMVGESGMNDGGPQAINDFKSGHICNEFCVKFGLEPFQ